MKNRHMFARVAIALASIFLMACGSSSDSTSTDAGTGGGGTTTPPSITFTPLALQELDATSTFSAALAINNNGQIIGVSEDATAAMKAVTWTVDQTGQTAGVATMLSPLEGNAFSSAHGLNDGGMIVGKSQLGAETVPVVWTAGVSIPAALATLAVTTSGAAYSINTAGQIVGEAQIAIGDVSHAIFWNSKDAAAQNIATLAGGTISAAYFIADTGTIVGESNDTSGTFKATVWTMDAIGVISAPQVLSSLNATDIGSIALGVNAAGMIVGEVELASGELHAVMWDTTTLAITDLGPTGASSSASAINATGTMAGWSNTTGIILATQYDSTAPTTHALLLDDDLTFSQAYGLNDAETFVGISGDQALVVIKK